MKSTVLLVNFLVCSVLLSAQEMGKQNLTQLEESPLGSRILNYITMVNDGEEVTASWINEQFSSRLVSAMSLDKLQRLIGEIREMEGQLHLYQARRTDMFRYKLIMKGVKSNEWLDMVFTFEQEEPNRILGITLDSTDAEPETSQRLFPKL